MLLGNGDGTFQAAVNYGAGDWPSSVAIGDLDGDGDLDLAVANDDSDDVSVLLGNGDGTFQPAVNYGAGDSPHSVAIGDLNGDGDLDLAVANQSSDDVSVLLGNGDGTFQAAVNYGAGDEPSPVAIGDLNGDGDLDLAVANAGSGSVSVLINISTDTVSELALDFGSSSSLWGLWHLEGATWTPIAWHVDVDDLERLGSELVIDCGNNGPTGLWYYTPGVWSPITMENVEGMEEWNNGLAIDRGANGLWNVNRSSCFQKNSYVISTG